MCHILYYKDIIFDLSIKFRCIIVVHSKTSTVIKGEQAPQVADFTGLKSNPSNYLILFFLPRLHRPCFYMSHYS